MHREIEEYIEYISKLKDVQKPPMPTFDVSAYDDNEYVSAVRNVMSDFGDLDSCSLTIQYLKGKDGS